LPEYGKVLIDVKNAQEELKQHWTTCSQYSVFFWKKRNFCDFWHFFRKISLKKITG